MSSPMEIDMMDVDSAPGTPEQPSRPTVARKGPMHYGLAFRPKAQPSESASDPATNPDADSAVEEEMPMPHPDMSSEMLLSYLTKPSEPCTSFLTQSHSTEPENEKEYSLYVNHSAEYLRPILGDRYIDAAKLFTALSGHEVPDANDSSESDDEVDLDQHKDVQPSLSRKWRENHPSGMPFWSFLRDSPAAKPYAAFSSELSSSSLTIRSLVTPRDTEWSRVDFGRLKSNMGVTQHPGFFEPGRPEATTPVAAPATTPAAPTPLTPSAPAMTPVTARPPRTPSAPARPTRAPPKKLGKKTVGGRVGEKKRWEEEEARGVVVR